MNRTTMGALALVVLGLFLIGGYKWLEPFLKNSHEVSTSDAARAQGTITIGMDNFIGYFPLCSPFMQQLMLSDGLRINCVDDKASYADRFQQLGDGKIDLAVATVDTYVLVGERANYPGVIVSVIDESKGSDAILARESAVKNLTELKSRQGLRLAFTPDSPSDHLRKVVGRDFDIPLFQSKDPRSQIKTVHNASAEARQALLSGKAQVAILWEPDISKALSHPGIIRLLGSEKTDKVIVDILIANRDYLDKYPDRVKALLKNYFKTLKHYRDNPDKLREDAAPYAKVPEGNVDAMVKGVAWANLADNARHWLGLSSNGQLPEYGLIETIEKTVKILEDVGDVPDNPLPDGEPRRIINSDTLAALFKQGLRPGFGQDVTNGQNDNPLEAKFPPLLPMGWDRLREVGTLRIPPLLFSSGDDTLTLEDREQLERAAEALKSYPYFRIEVQGNTRPGGDEMANHDLSQSRADAVARYLEVTYGIDPDRLRARGFGSARPLPTRPGEAYRSYQDRLSRVEIHLKSEEY